MAHESKPASLHSADGHEGRPSIQMTHDRVLVRPPGAEERKTKSGLLVPATAAEGTRRCVWAEVVAIGPNVRTFEPGDHVLVSADAGYEAQIRGEDFVLLREREVHAIASERADSGTGLYL